MTPAEPLAVRRVREGEGPQLRDVRLRALRDSPTAFASTTAREEALPPQEWERRAADPDAVSFVAVDRDGWWGLVTGLRDGAGVHLLSMWVDPRRRGSGAAAGLVDAVVAWACGIGAGAVELWVVDGNEPAATLYRRAGFAPTGERQPLPSHPELVEQQMLLRLDSR
ncbi:MAG: GNAT family N-acetyltransferase [Acidimicrobiales bacterium]